MTDLAQQMDKVFPFCRIGNRSNFHVVNRRHDEHPVSRANVTQDQLDGFGFQPDAHTRLIIKRTTQRANVQINLFDC